MADLDKFVPAIVAGDTEAFARWVARAEPIMRGCLRPYAASVDVEAILQESLLRVWQKAPRLVPDGRANCLLRVGIRIAQNLAMSEVRQLHGKACDQIDFEQAIAQLDAGISLENHDPMLRSLIQECRENLPRKPALALAQRLKSGGAEPDSVLAAKVRMSLNTFLQNFTRARRLLADCLKKMGVDIKANWP